MFFRDFETERLRLIGISFEDREFMLKQFSDELVNRYLFDQEPMRDLAEADELIRFYTQPEPRGQHRWILCRKDTGEKIGTCGYHCWDREARKAEIGYDLNAAHWGKGFMTEALRPVLAFGAQEMGLSAIEAQIYGENERSIRLAKSLGFIRAGQGEPLLFRGSVYPHELYRKRFGAEE